MIVSLKAIGLLLGFAFSCLPVIASEYSMQDIACDTTSNSKLFINPEVPPRFPGGDAALMKYIADNLKYPPEAAEKNIEGKVVVRFLIDTIGNVGEVQILRSVDESLDHEAIRVIKTLPKFMPASINCKAVERWYNVPLTFKLNKEASGENCDIPEKMPEFPGGDEALLDFLRQNVRYPDWAARRSVEGRVVVQFIVDKDGKIGDIEVVESVDKDLDEEAIRVCKLLPDFSPAILHGEPVSVLYTLPITFMIPRYEIHPFRMVASW